jgi:chemotaxis protein histidine kinase CheA/ActR/RegA family two-component response regulator
MNPSDRAQKELLEEFQRTAAERIERIDAAWVAMESGSSAPSVSEDLLRELHTLKGEARLMGFSEASLLLHAMEELVLSVRGKPAGAEIGNALLAASDAVATLCRGAAAVDIAGLTSSLERLTKPSEGSAAAVSVAPLPARPAEPSVSSREDFVRIEAALAARLADATGEAVLAHSRYAHLCVRLRDALGDVAPEAAALLDRLGDELYSGSVAARELELSARTLRLVPLPPILRRYVRAVRDLSGELGKPARTAVSDADVAVDRRVVDALAEPLLHLVRNAVDHGLEPAAERARAGKPTEGRIALSCERRDGGVVVVVEDDGGGVDLDRVRRRGDTLGLVAAGRTLSDAEAMALLFAAGFSTRERASQTSGRGVGLDIVKRRIEALGGSVRVSSTRGRGTRFELHVPISLALTRALVIETGGLLCAIPQAAVEGVLTVRGADLEVVHQSRTLSFRGERVALAELSAALELPAGPARDSIAAVVVRSEEQHVALAVDNWRGDAEILIRSLGELLSHSDLASGACVLEGGELALVLNPARLVARALGEIPLVRRAAELDAQKSRTKSILLAEDSAITRAMVARLLRMLGYDVREAADGAQALRALEVQDVDLLLTDVEMPNVDGIELIRRVRAQDKLRRLPIIVLSTRGSAEDKQRALRAGADAYLVKTEFSEQVLRDALARQLGGA